MERKSGPDSYWRKKLSKDAYEALRLGKMEEPYSGKYVNTDLSGTYLCAGCMTPLFDSSQKFDDGSGHATFRIKQNDKRFLFEQVYLEDGNKPTKVICSACRGRVGELVGDESENEKTVHVNLSSVFLKKKFTPKNYPLLYIFLLIFISMGILSALSFGGYMQNENNTKNSENVLHLQILNEDIVASIIYIDKLKPESQSVVFGKDAIFVIFSKKENSPRLRLPKHPLDVLWLDSAYTVLSGEKRTGKEEDNILTPFENVAFALVTNPGELPDDSFKKGFKIFVSEK